MTIDKYVIPNTVSVHHVTDAPDLQTEPLSDHTPLETRLISNITKHNAKSPKLVLRKVNKTGVYNIDKTMRHIEGGRQVKFFVYRYGYGSAQRTIFCDSVSIDTGEKSANNSSFTFFHVLCDYKHQLQNTSLLVF